jgi:hypothetical protein
MSNSPVKHTTANTYTLNANTVPNGGYTLIGNANTNYGYGNITIAPSSSYIISNGSSGMNWANTASPNMTVGKVKITETDMTVGKVKITETDIEIEGLSLRKTLLDLQARLAIMTPNPVLEKEFDELKACGDRYRELEKEFTEQLKMWNTLKSTDR